MIVRKRSIVNVQVMLKQHWASNSVALLIHIKGNQEGIREQVFKAVVISHYSQP